MVCCLPNPNHRHSQGTSRDLSVQAIVMILRAIFGIPLGKHEVKCAVSRSFGEVMRDPSTNVLRGRVYDFISETVLPPLRWPEFAQLLQRRREVDLSSVAFIEVLPAQACLSAGGNLESAIPLTGLWLLYLVAARVFDDLCDEPEPHLSMPAAIREPLMKGVYALGAANAALSHLVAARRALSQILLAYGNMVALAAQAQNARYSQNHRTVVWYFENIAARTALVVATAAWSGALVSASEPAPELLDAFSRYGIAVGTMSQILDDCEDLVTTDLAAGTYTLPVVYALSLREHNQHSRLVSLLQSPTKTGSWVRTVESILHEMDAVSWSLQVAALYRDEAVASLTPFPRDRVAPLVDYAVHRTAHDT